MEYPSADAQALDTIRLEHDWTWDELSLQMKRAGIEVSPRTLHYVLKRSLKPLDRTMHKIRKFVQIIEEREQRRAKRQKRQHRKAAAVAVEQRP